LKGIGQLIFWVDAAEQAWLDDGASKSAQNALGTLTTFVTV
jgi:hypothetical protein